MYNEMPLVALSEIGISITGRRHRRCEKTRISLALVCKTFESEYSMDNQPCNDCRFQTFSSS